MGIETYLKRIDALNETGPYRADWKSLAGHKIPDWFREGRFGIFIHWGVYSVPGFHEWYPRFMYNKTTPHYRYHKKNFGDPASFGYKEFIPMFTAPDFDADSWCSLFAKSGAKYIMPVAEHHDGFKMYQSDLSTWNALAMGPKRDVLAELKEACARHELEFLTSSHRAERYWYYNFGRTIDGADVNDEAYREFYGPAVMPKGVPAIVGNRMDSIEPTEEWCEDWLAHTAELIDRTKPLAVYFDWWIRQKPFRPYLKRFLAYYYNRAEEWGKQVTVFYKWDAFIPTSGVFDVERGQLEHVSPELWQNDTSIGKYSWGYSVKNKFKTTEDILSNLVDVISKNGCFMLNVGPDKDGNIPPEERAVLEGIGDWFTKNGEAVYGSRPYKFFGEGPAHAKGSFSENIQYTHKDFRFTYKDGAIYAFAMAPPKQGKYKIKSLADANDHCNSIIQKITLLGADNPVGFVHDAGALTLQIEGALPESLSYPVCFKIEID